MPHRKQFETWRDRLSEVEYRNIKDELNQMIGDGEMHTSSWMPGSDWSGTAFQPIYDKACFQDEQKSAKFFGLILWKVMLEHEDTWSFGRYKRNNIPIEGLTYFRVQP